MEDHEDLKEDGRTRIKFAWNGIMFWVVAFTALEAPYSFVYKTKIQNWQLVTDLVASTLFLIDLFFGLRQLLKDRSKIEKKEFKWGLVGHLPQAIGAIPFDVICHFLGLSGYFRLFRLIRLLRFYKTVKIYSLVGSLTVIPLATKIQFAIMGCLTTFHWMACGWILLNPLPEKLTQWEYYVHCLYWVVTTLTTVGYGDITPSTLGARLYTMIVMILGVGFYGVVIGNVSRMISMMDRYKEESREKLNELNLFMKHYEIPKKVQKSIFDYYNHLYEKRLSENDTKIIADLPHALQEELQIYMNIKLIKSIPLFSSSSPSCLKAVATSLEQLNFSPKGAIIHYGEIGNEMFILGHGEVLVTTEDGTLLAELPKGAFFGEMALIKEGERRNANIVAKSYCEVYRLSKEDFLTVIEKFPKLKKDVEKVMAERAGPKKAVAKKLPPLPSQTDASEEKTKKSA